MPTHCSQGADDSSGLCFADISEVEMIVSSSSLRAGIEWTSIDGLLQTAHPPEGLAATFLIASRKAGSKGSVS